MCSFGVNNSWRVWLREERGIINDLHCVGFLLCFAKVKLWYFDHHQDGRNKEHSNWVRWRSDVYSLHRSVKTPRSELIIMSCKQHAHIHNSDLINHLNRRHSAVPRLICGPGLDVNIKSWKQGRKQREATNMCNPASWCFYQEAGRLAVHYTSKAPQHSVQDLPCGFSLILALELYWYPVCRDIKGNKAFCANQQL